MDWLNFFRQHNIPYVEYGNNVAKGHINIRCPFCGRSDPSEHMGVHLTDDYWGCWRNRTHRGEAPQRLIMALIKCSYSRACEIAGRRNLRDLSELGDVIKRLNGDVLKDDFNKKYESLSFPNNFNKIKNVGNGELFYSYLVSRGFNRKDIKYLIDKYELQYCMSGSWKGRLILPLYFDGELVSWIGRTVYKNVDLRYKNLTTDPQKSEDGIVARYNAKQIVFNFDELLEQGGRTLYITEGPFDALKVDFYGHYDNIRATCLFGVSYTKEQLYLLCDLLERFDRVKILFDNGFLSASMDLHAALSSRKVSMAKLPDDVKDPGDLTEEQVYRLL